jgi:hypothetical protein
MMALSSCETDITLDLPTPQEKLVVEGHIENGDYPYVVLTRNFSFYAGVNPGQLQNLFVHNAMVMMNDGTNDYQLTELCLSTLPDSIKQLVLDYLGIDEADLGTQDFCAYFTLLTTGQQGKTYSLTVDTLGQHLSAITTIPFNVPIDSLWAEPAASDPDSLRILFMQFDEPDTIGNYYRYWTKANDEPFYPGYFGSVLDDKFFNGEVFQLNLDRGYASNAAIDFDTYGLFRVGDTVVVKIAMIDEAHYEFWRTVEEQTFSGGPFSIPVHIRDNIQGGLGIWGGYGAVYDTIVIQ